MAAEMLEARRAANPLEFDIVLGEEAGPGLFAGQILRTGAAGVILVRSELLLGRERVPGPEPVTYGNFYVGGSTNNVYINERFDPAGHDLVTLRVTGIPENGLEQSLDFQYRIAPTIGLERLSSPAVTADVRVVGDDLGIGLANISRRTISIEQAGVAATRTVGGFTDWGGAYLPITMEPGEPNHVLRAKLSLVKGTLFPDRARWVWFAETNGATRWSAIPADVAARLQEIRRRVKGPRCDRTNRRRRDRRRDGRGWPTAGLIRQRGPD
jgi:hypothetical protein